MRIIVIVRLLEFLYFLRRSTLSCSTLAKGLILWLVISSDCCFLIAHFLPILWPTLAIVFYSPAVFSYESIAILFAALFALIHFVFIADASTT